MVDTNNGGNASDVIIIGAGISGLTSALRILEKVPDLKVTILEASDKAGGQLQSTNLGEIGAKWLTEEQTHVYRLLKDLKISTHRRSVVGENLKKYWELEDGLCGKLAKYEVNRYIRELELKMDSYKTLAARCRTLSMKSHLSNRLFFSRSRQFMGNLILTITGVNAQEIRYLDFMDICHSCGGLWKLIDLLYEAPNSLLEFSSTELLSSLLTHLERVNIKFGRKVCSIYQYRDVVEVRDCDSNLYTADAIVLAVPWNYMQAMEFHPTPPGELRCLPGRTDESKHVITSFLANYKKAHWTACGYSGQFVALDPVLAANEYRPTTICGYCVHAQDKEPQVRSIVLHKLSQKFGEEMLMPIAFEQRTFELSIMNHASLTTPWNRIIWSSSAAAGTCCRGFLGGAVQSGLRGAINALLLVRPQRVMWQDISEVQCHDDLPRRNVSWFSIWLSSWNLYSCGTYLTFLCGLVLILHRTYKKTFN